MKSRPAFRLWPAVLLLAVVAIAEAAYTAGGFAFTKRVETNLVREPKSLESVGKLGFKRKVKVDQVQGGWLQVSDGPAMTGWVFAGNLSLTAPDEVKGLNGLPLSASETSAAAAARPLSPIAGEYAAQHNLYNARNDLEWMLTQCQAITVEDVNDFMKAQKRGEFQ